MIKTQGPLSTPLAPTRLNFEPNSPSYNKSTNCAVFHRQVDYLLQENNMLIKLYKILVLKLLYANVVD